MLSPAKVHKGGCSTWSRKVIRRTVFFSIATESASSVSCESVTNHARKVTTAARRGFDEGRGYSHVDDSFSPRRPSQRDAVGAPWFTFRSK